MEVGGKRITTIRLRHKGINWMFKCKVYRDEHDFSDKELEIAFDDLSEVNTLIWMLDRFRSDCKDANWIWEKG